MPGISLSAEVRQFASAPSALFIDGVFARGSGDPLTLLDPATEEAIARFPEASPADVERVVASADQAFRDRRWTGLRPADRERILLQFANLVEQHGEELAQLETWNQGKSIAIARAVDVGASVEYMRYIAGLATKTTGLTLDLSIPVVPGGRYHAYTRPEPVGVVAAIAPWNFPMMIALWKVMPALAAGCTVVLKPSEFTPLSALRLAELAIEAGVPAGVFNVAVGRGATTGTALVGHPAVAKVSFTGSTATGKQIGRAAIDRMARFSLELGGKNPAIVLADADPARIAPGLLGAAFLNSGQVCASLSRIYVERPAYEGLLEALREAVKAMTIGPGLDPAMQINPLVSAQHRDRVRERIREAGAAGATAISGAAVPSSGFYVSPTLVTGAGSDAAIQREEVFGPVLSVTPVDNADAAVQLANDSPYGLVASIWSNDLSRTMDLIPRIEAGTVYVNTHVPVDPNLPFGGYKQSGLGRDFGPDALAPYTEIKSVCVAY
ncbi:aldehyde dehydrogenase family protein [Altererythrobacter sp. Root672]|uniref:aldehyde dehydrogenase family protein n=1 Tax=Altererythrobacter sp. Root672 TaxID=1736584 RepID=UPI0006FDE1B5|nr:aldehyde dehydrogenase family protein [Altererythrobacter sp. Root672]KRA84205.1 NAD-dependent phenylacetaldehyde dehydrogenase [Altererythrobacter sp. Root672]